MSDERVPRHPVDAVVWFAERLGIELDPERVAAMREYCDEETTMSDPKISLQSAMSYLESDHPSMTFIHAAYDELKRITTENERLWAAIRHHDDDACIHMTCYRILEALDTDD